MVEQARAVRADLKNGSRTRLDRIDKSLAATVGHEVAREEAADVVAQAAACAAPILAAAPTARVTCFDWLKGQLNLWEQAAIRQAEVLSTGYSVLCTANHGTDLAHLFEHFLHHYKPSGRKRGGVFFTPQPIADCIVRGVDRLLREDFSIADGLADGSLTILDPACGTGVFLLSLIDHLRDRVAVENVLPRLAGIEILPAAALLAKLNIALALGETGGDLTQVPPLNIIIADALSPATQSKIQNSKSKIPVIIGNPPFSSLSTTTNDWIAQLVRGDDEVRGYVRANGQRLNEKKTWLHDDYVKFMRLAQWHVEQAGCGIVGFVTNHGFLDNATFRLMRQELLRVFPRIEIVDLHGNRKKHERAPDGGCDENVFGLDQGVAIGLFCRPPTLARSASEGIRRSTIEYAELWGSRNHKLEVLAAPAQQRRLPRLPSLALRASVLMPSSPDWRFVPTPTSPEHSEYEAGWSLAAATPVYTTAPVTARDHFVVAFTAEELRARIEEFRDLSLPDEEIRRRYFQRTRSARYQVGDTRGWKLTDARRAVAADQDWPQKIVRCLYRPFDWRYVFWHPAMIDWPRREVTRHLIENQELGIRSQESEYRIQNPKSKIQNLCLIARRQQLPTQPCTFFWISDGLALDGVIRSDNRGSESLFPLYLLDAKDGKAAANFALPLIDQISGRFGLSWLPLGSGDLRQTFGPEDMLAYIYGLFHSPDYRERHADDLRRDFPRVIVPSSASLFEQMALFGSELIALHLLRLPDAALSKPSHESAAIADFRAGGYFALRKWLQPKHRSTADPEYSQIVAAIARTIEIMAAIEAAVKQSGGWESAFGAKAT